MKMEKTRTKRFALIALLLSLALVACGFGILSSPLAAKADGEVEITFERALTASNWNATDQVTVMTDAGWNNDRDASNGTVSAVKVVSGSTTYNATHVYAYGNRLRFFFYGSGYNGQSPADGDRLEVSSDFTITLGGVAYKTSTGVIYTYNATTKTWTSNHVENLEGDALNVYVQQGLFSKYSVQTDSGYTDNDTSTLRTKALPYINLSSKSGFVGIPWTYYMLGTQLDFFMHDGSLGATGNLGDPVEGMILTVYKGFRHDGAPGKVLKEDVSYIFDGSNWTKYVPAIDFTVEENLTMYTGATLNLAEKVTVTPANSTDSITYTKVDGDITVSASGVVTAGTTAGTAHVKIKVGDIEKTVAIEVTPAPELSEIRIKGGAKIELYQYDPLSYISYDGIKGEYVYSDDSTAEFDITAADVTLPDGFNTDTPGDFTATVTKGGKTCDLTITVKASTEIFVRGIYWETGWKVWRVEFSSANTLPQIGLGAETELSTKIISRMKPYIEYELSALGKVKTNPTPSLISTSNAYLFIDNFSNEEPDVVRAKYHKGDLLTLKAGLGFLDGEYLLHDVTYAYDGMAWTLLSEPSSITIKEKPEQFYVGGTYRLEFVETGYNVAFNYTSSNPSVASVSEDGVISFLTASDEEVTVTVSYTLLSGANAGTTLSDSLTFTVADELPKKGIRIVSDVRMFYVPVSTADAPTSFVSEIMTKNKYTLKACYIYEDDSESELFDIEESHIGTLDYTKAGDYNLTITVDGFTDTVKVHVYEYVEVGMFDTIGVNGYEDDRNQPGEWSGHMLVGMDSISPSVANVLGGKELSEMASYVSYTRYDGDTSAKISVWLLGHTLLVINSLGGFTYPAEGQTLPKVYALGDKITFAKGMPIYGWYGEVDISNNAVPGTGFMYVVGFLKDDYTYFCYEQDEIKSLWQLYKEYTDFTVRDSISLTVGSTAPIGAQRNPIDATTGKFTYSSSNEAIATVSESGTITGISEGTVTITVTLTGGKDADGNPLDPIVKTVEVTVKRGISKVEGSIKVKKGSKVDLSKYTVTVTYTDGTTEEIKLNDSRVTIEDIDTSVIGEESYTVMVQIDGQTKRGVIVVTVVNSTGCASCSSEIGGLGGIFGGLALLVVALVLVRRRKNAKA